ncbi:SDR family NAD(P)-dependent oxidoreductase [Streptomyces sp. NPDC127117]|uniref:SDR family NAD(P)-dependent oxidoreductase n=1 Tax=Streptomyces sp. NPDC127117 TaxID=3345368 RepID=UPI003639346A
MTWPAEEAALVTGAASGIGFSIARALVAAGAKDALVDIDEAWLAEAEESLRDAERSARTGDGHNCRRGEQRVALPGS